MLQRAIYRLLPTSQVPPKLSQLRAVASSKMAAPVVEQRLATSFAPADRLRNFLAPTVWHVFTPLATQTNAVNLGQGFPGFSPPEFVLEAAEQAIRQQLPVEAPAGFMSHQYCRSQGEPSLVKELARVYSQQLGREVDWASEVQVTNGATGALNCAIASLVDPGDEVVVLEPAFDVYQPQVEMAGGSIRPVPLEVELDAETGEKRWVLSMERFEAAFNANTRVLILNTPHNPTGKVFAREQLQAIARVVKAHPKVVVIADEVYKHLVYDGHSHVSIASLDEDMFQRTLTVDSAGKTFSVTGWKIGWAVGPAHLVRGVSIANQWNCFSVNTSSQQTVARALQIAEQPYHGFDSYYIWLREEYARKRDILGKALQAAGIQPIQPEGSFFIVGDTSGLKCPEEWLEKGKELQEPHDWSICRWLCVEGGVASIPPSSFYCEQNKQQAANLARFAFCKPDEVLQEAGDRLLQRLGSKEQQQQQ